MDSVIQKPLVSLCICFYNQEDFVNDAVKGALSQTYENLEVILSDDNSTDRTYERIQNAVSSYKGPHKIIINKNKTNIGLVPHFNNVLFNLSHGKFLFIQGGDDISLPNRITDGVQIFMSDPTITALTSSSIYIDRNGNETGKMCLEKDYRTKINDKKYLYASSFMCGSGMLAIQRKVIDKFGRLNDNCQTEDSCMRFRALLLGDIYSSHKFGVKYRVHSNNISIGNAVFKLKTHPIAEQYRRDLEQVKNSVPSILYKILKKKIDFYEQIRNIDAALATEKNSQIRVHFLSLKRKIINIVYHRYLTFHINDV